ncbi:MAG: ribosome biogenesis GTP-binding protein YihA/YsxC [Candidatus Kapaibacteriota bacterium]|jgi:GTP-binding protein
MAKLTYNADFIFASANKGNFPKHDLPEICFVGRSNVGKSSLINSIVKRKNLARVSVTPGKTQQINFYNVEDTWCLVDLPGFGYTSKGRTIGSDWKINNFEYVKNRENLKLICLLVDSRHDPMEIDLGLMEELEIMQRKYIVVLTKCDKINSTMIAERTQQWAELLVNCNYNIELLPYSSVSGLGRNNIIAVIKKYCSKEYANSEE